MLVHLSPQRHVLFRMGPQDAAPEETGHILVAEVLAPFPSTLPLRGNDTEDTDHKKQSSNKSVAISPLP